MGQDKTGGGDNSRVGQDRTVQHSTEQDRGGQDRTELERKEQSRTGCREQNRKGQDKAGQVKIKQS
jgi:hypothetical protein